MKITKFEELTVWQDAVQLNKKIYYFSDQGLFKKDFGLRDQIRRASVSISSNIVEGYEKNNNNEFVRFLRIAKGSAGEVRSQLYIALSLNYINQENFNELMECVTKLSNQIGSLIVYLQKLRNSQTR